MGKVAIIGFSFRFPSTDATQYWDDLLNARDLVTSVEAGRWAQETFLHPSKTHPGTAYTFAAGSIGDVSGFDADFFGISPREAALMDPQQRLLLELSWEAFESAGIKPSSLRGSRSGVFIGIASADYAYRLADDLAAVDSSVATGNTSSIAANRLSYFFDLRGPSMAIDTACSSSVVAFHQACRSILSGETEQALTGGVSLHLHPYGFITFSKASMLSRRGRCRVFDASGDGYVRSEGGGLFLLKDYDKAVADGDRILAVVAHSAVNTDGHKSGITVPSHDAQAALLTESYRQAGIAPSDIDYLEAHGTGTAVGDPIETRALGEALGKKRPSDKPLLIGSVKSNLGHLEAASGVAGLVKALYCVRHRLVPATIGVETPNPHIHFEDWNLHVVTQNQPLRETGVLTVGVNSFGFGGANAHVILQSVEAHPKSTAKLKKNLVLPVRLSAKSPAGLKAVASDFAALLQGSQSLYDIAYASIFRREQLEHSAVVLGSSAAAISESLRQFVAGETVLETGTTLAAPSGPVFVYSGNGAQWIGMGRRLLKLPVFKKAIRQVDAIFQQYADYSLEDELNGKNGEARYQYTEIAQPALFAVQVGVTVLLRHSGIQPIAVTGHSVGEVAAAWACGALSLADAVQVIYHRSRLQGHTKGSGKMTAVGLDAPSAEALLQELGLSQNVCISGFNSPKGVTVAGSEKGLTRLEATLAAKNVFFRRLDLDYAFHSSAMDQIEADIRQALADLKPVKSTIPFYSTVTGEVLAGTALDAEYWWHNVRHPVLFDMALSKALASGATVFVEVGPHPVLRTYVNDCLKAADVAGRLIPTLLRDDDDPARVAGAVAQTMIAGASIDWRAFFPKKGAFVDLPIYPWQRETHWHPVTTEALGMLYRHKIHPLLGYPLPQRELAWENTLDVQTHPALADHVVGDATVFPGTGFAELALAAALAWHPGEYAEIEELEIRSPLLLGSEHAKLLRFDVDGQDGSFTVKAREYAGSEPLALHAVGRILREPSGIWLQQTLPLLPERAPDFDGAIHEQMTQALGLAYGPAFRAIQHGWAEGDTAVALFQMPPILQAEWQAHYLHPALLDCAFQLIIQIVKDANIAREGIAFVPTKLGRISFRASSAKPTLVQAHLRRRSPHSLLADFTLFDEQGRALAFIKDARFRSIRLHKGAAEQVRHLECHVIPKPHLSTAVAAALSFEQTQQVMKEAVRRCVLKGAHRRYSEEVDPLLDGLCSRFTLAVLDIDRQAVLPDIEPFLSHLLAMAREDGLLDGAAAAEGLATAQDIWNSLVADYPDYFKIIHSVGRVGMHLRTVLESQSGGDLAAICPCDIPTLSRQVLGGAGRHVVGQALRDWVAASLAALPEGQRLSVVEFCEGPPLFALDICPSLDFERADFSFVSLSSESLEEARRLHERFPAIALRQMSTETPNEANGTAQLAIVLLDFAKADNALRALEQAKACLAPGASLVVLGLHPARWMDFVFGSTPGWWSDTTSGTPGARQRPARFWLSQLEQLGFVTTQALEFSPDTASGPYMLLGRLDDRAIVAPPAPRAIVAPWLILANAQGYSAALAERLRKRLTERGEKARVVSLPDVASVGQVLPDVLAAAGALSGIVHLLGLEIASSATDVRQQVERCAGVAALLKACEVAQTNPRCWIVTAGAMVDYLPGRRPSGWRTSLASFSDSALWGFVRTLMNEASGQDIRLVDLEEPYALDSAIAALEREFLALDAEQEVLLTGAGARFVPRFRLKPRHGSGVVADDAVLRLGFQMPGQLRNLRWEAFPLLAPGVGELAVEVQATGLNFRDVMYALGMLSDEAIENGFAGSSLGLEFAGIVRAVGPGVTGFALGDRVVGFGPSSFSNRVITQAEAASPIPPGMSFEAAATIPSTFFTAYYALHHLGRLSKGEKVLIHGAAGGVGIAAIQVAKWCGAEIFATAGSDEKRDFLHLLGVEHVYDSRSLAFADEILADTQGEGVDAVLNSLAGEAVNRNLRVLKPFGRFLELGKRDFYENTRIGLRPFRNNISYFGIDADQLMSTQPQLTGRLFGEVMALFIEGVLHPLPYHAFEAEDVVDAFRYMQQSKQIGKVVVTYRNGLGRGELNRPHYDHTDSRRLALSANSSYLVTGGLGGFGLKAAQWLVAKGARYLVLVSRSGLVSDESKQAVAMMEAAGVTVFAKACDVTDKAQLQALLAEVETTAPLKGIIHSAMVIDDALIRNMETTQIRRVFEPKILGAQNLHELTLHKSLDFFVLFSSATTLFGNPGQGNYVAANLWLEALARHRRGLGLPATSVAWGAIGDIGFLARHEKAKEALQSRMGGTALHSAVALDALEHLLLDNASGEGVLDFDWRALSRFLPSAATPKFSELALHADELDGDEGQAEDIHRLLVEFSDEELLATFAEMVKQEVGEILRVAPDKIDSSRPIQLMGLDSLMGVELAVALESRFGVRLPVMVLSENPSIDKLAVRILAQLRGNEETESAADGMLNQVRRTLAQHAPEVGADAMTRFAEDLQTGNEAGWRMIQ